MAGLKANKIVDGFWHYLKKEGATNLVGEIIQLLKDKADEVLGSAKVVSSNKLNQSQAEKISKILKEGFNIHTVEFVVDKRIVGGIKVRIGDNEIDLSAKNKLDYISKNL